jgi:Predicted DNA-binding protein with PD1-like DNA-binding motif
MKASEGKAGRVFLVRMEQGDNGAEAVEKFAADNGIQAGQVYVTGERSISGIIAPDADGRPGLRLSGGMDRQGAAWDGAEVVIQELLGLTFLRVMDPSSGKETLAKIASTKTRVMERPAPEPEEKGPGTIPVYLFNAEFN